MKRLRLALAAFVDTWNGTSAYYALHVANADRARLAAVCCEMRKALDDALARAEHAEGENQRLTDDNKRLERWLQQDDDTLEERWRLS